MSRKGDVWRGELAQRIGECLEGTLPPDELLDWALEHPFFEDQEELSPEEQWLLGQALGAVLHLSPDEPPVTRTTRERLTELATMLWRGLPQPGTE